MNYNILVSTKGLSRTEWLKARQLGIGGSDAAAVTGNSRFSSPLKVYVDKTTPITEETPDIQNEAMRQGKDLEEYCAQRFEEATGKSVRRVNAIVQNPDHPFILANIDRRVDGENAILECKTTRAYSEAAKAYAAGMTPVEYEIQCHHYMLATGADVCYLAAVVLGEGFYWFPIKRDEDVIKALLEQETAFWNNHVLILTPPDWDGSEAASEILKAKYPEVNHGEAKELSNELFAEVQTYKDMTRIKKELEQKLEQVKQRLLDALGEAETGLIAGEEAVRRVLVPGGETIDSKKLKAEKPDIYAAYAKPRAGYVKLTVKEV